jgi:hypothetical protein
MGAALFSDGDRSALGGILVAADILLELGGGHFLGGFHLSVISKIDRNSSGASFIFTNGDDAGITPP